LIKLYQNFISLQISSPLLRYNIFINTADIMEVMMDNLKKQAPLIGLVLGIVFLVIGLNYNNTALLILGGIFLLIGVGSRVVK